MKKIIIDFVQQKDQRYATVGDYWETDYAIHFRITDLGNANYSWAVLLHELAEKRLKDIDGVSDAEVDAWDMEHPELDEPGLNPNAPYHASHMMADSLEREFIIFAGESWIAYEEAIEGVFNDESYKEEKE